MNAMTPRTLLALLPLAALVACGSKTPAGPTKPPGLYAEPSPLPFTCVTPGCA